MKHKNPSPHADSDYQVYLLRLRRDAHTGKWYISLQPGQETQQHIFANLDSLTFYLAKQMSGECVSPVVRKTGTKYKNSPPKGLLSTLRK